ncbi:MAG TPA: Na(+)/H(+) antiporter subunit D [Gammaproteobacteria bacterium]|nr:Na(+)/H(+) antiporter subunit D [Gammaproteobacteria bacterium]
MRTGGLPLPALIDAGWTIPPSLIFLAAAILTVLFARSRGLQRAVLIGAPIAGLVNLVSLEPGSAWTWSVLELELVQLRVDRLSLLFGLLFHIGAALGIVYALRVRDTMQHAAALVYAGCALGAVFAGDLITLFLYWEGMALSSALLVWAGRKPGSSGAGLRYLVMHLGSGLLLLAGVLMHYRATGSLAFDFIGTNAGAGWLMLAAFGIKCGFPFVHTWITDAYPRSTPSGTVFLSMFTTKVAVYALARGFPGTELLVPIGTAMALFPIFYAVIENDLRRVLGYSMINQIGFMVVGIGIGTELALAGAVAHAFNEVIFKGLLFMTMGAVLLRAGHALGSDLGGLYRSMPVTTACCIVGAASISAFPLASGFVSKSLIMTAMLEAGHGWLWLGLLFASAGVFHHAGIKIPYFAFFSHDSGLRTREAPPCMLAAMIAAAFGCLLIGMRPDLLYALLPWPVEYAPYTYAHVVAQLQLLFFSALAFAWLKLSGVYPTELRSVNLDADWLYRRHGPALARGVLGATLRGAAAYDAALARVRAGARRTVAESFGTALRLASTGQAALLVGALLCGYVLLYLYASA